MTEGRYAVGFSFFLNGASAFGMLVAVYLLKGVGHVSGTENQSEETVDNLALMRFTIGPVFLFISFLIQRKLINLLRVWILVPAEYRATILLSMVRSAPPMC